MKHIPKLPAEPPALTAYRAANAADAMADGTMSAEVWNRFRDHAAYKDVRFQLLAQQQGLCGYCEQRISLETGQLLSTDQQIEHVLPKSGGADRTLNWTNLVLCCVGGTNRHHTDASRKFAGSTSVSCGQSKGDKHLDHGCDPRDFPCTPRLLNVGIDGTISASASACAAVGINPQDLDRTINEVLNLNCQRLKLARRKIADQVRAWLIKLVEETLVGTHLSQDKQDAFRALMVEGRLGLDANGHLRAFWTTERQYLEPWSSDWLSQNHLLLGCMAAACSQVSP